MRIIPVIDLMNGTAVHAVAGRRSEYRPLVSRLCTSTDPLAVADAFRARFAFTELYVADLDAIGGAEPAWPLFAELRSRGFQLWVDPGVCALADAERLAAAGIERVVVGLETVRGPAELRAMVSFGPDRIAFSLDLKDGRPLGDASAWRTTDAATVAERALALGVRRLIVLDLGLVGVGAGVGTEELCRRLATQHPHIELIAGGGVRDANDLKRLEQCGVSAALVASALHAGTLP